MILGSSQSSQVIEKIIYWILYSNEMTVICFLVMIFGIIFIIYKVKDKKFKKSSYYKITGNTYRKTRSDLGKWGEYLIFKELEHLEKEGARFLFNLYIPKSDETTTEIDVLVITPKGILVCESKNYSGWIFGSEFQKYWKQTLPKGRRSQKITFLNPIIQNKGHIKWLKNLIGDDIEIGSMIVFSERCTFKDLNVKSDTIRSENICVMQRFEIDSIVNDFMNRPNAKNLSEEQVNDLYNKLLVYTKVDEATKQRHIENIKKNVIVEDKQEPEEVKAVQEPQQVQEVQEAQKNENVVAEPEESKEVPCEPLSEPETSEVKPKEEESKAVEENEKICPLCGKALVIRTARYGKYAGHEFLGCTGYPKCNYIKNLD